MRNRGGQRMKLDIIDAFDCFVDGLDEQEKLRYYNDVTEYLNENGHLVALELAIKISRSCAQQGRCPSCFAKLLGDMSDCPECDWSDPELCADCGKQLNNSFGYCQNCVKEYMQCFSEELVLLVSDYPDLKLVPKGPNVLIQHKTGDEIYI